LPLDPDDFERAKLTQAISKHVRCDTLSPVKQIFERSRPAENDGPQD
jgi:hypothetical protein